MDRPPVENPSPPKMGTEELLKKPIADEKWGLTQAQRRGTSGGATVVDTSC